MPRARASAATVRSSSRWSAIQPAGRADGSRVGALGGELGAELRLVARPLRTNTTSQRAIARAHLGAEVVLDQGQRQVDPGGDTGRGPHVAVADEDRVGVDGHRRVPRGQLGAPGPVGGRAAAVEQAGPARRKAPVHTDVTRRARGRALAAATSAVVRGPRGAPAPPATTSVSIGPRPRPAPSSRAPDRSPLARCRPRRGERNGVGAGPQGARTGEHLRRPDGIERLAALEDDDDHVAGSTT